MNAVAAASPAPAAVQHTPVVIKQDEAPAAAPSAAAEKPLVEDSAQSIVTAADQPTTTPMEEEPEKPKQANRSRCFSCRKKVGLLGFECR